MADHSRTRSDWICVLWIGGLIGGLLLIDMDGWDTTAISAISVGTLLAAFWITGWPGWQRVKLWRAKRRALKAVRELHRTLEQ